MTREILELPANDPAEKVCIAILSNSYDAWELHSWHKELFHLPHNKALFELMEGAMQCGHPIDLMAISSLATEKNLIEDCGGILYITEVLTEPLGRAGSIVAYYHQQLDEVFQKRAAIKLLHSALPSVIHGDLSVVDLQEKVANLPSSRETFLSKLEARRVSLTNPPERPDSLFSANGIALTTAGNLTCLIAQAKAGKSALLTAFMGSAINPESECDTLGVTSENPEGKMVLHFDTEQSAYDLFQLVNRTLRRAELSTMPPNFESYRLNGLGVDERRKMLDTALSRASKKKAIHSVFLDGVADFANDPNDAAECFAWVDQLQAMAEKYHCAIISVLHENPKSDKSRGHLGSQLERKVETDLRLEKNDAGITSYYTKFTRNAGGIAKSNAIRFAWNGEAAMHTTCTDIPSESKTERERSEYRMLLAAVYEKASKEALSYKELTEGIANEGGKSLATAGRRLPKFEELKLIKKSELGYSFTP